MHFQKTPKEIFLKCTNGYLMICLNCTITCCCCLYWLWMTSQINLHRKSNCDQFWTLRTIPLWLLTDMLLHTYPSFSDECLLAFVLQRGGGGAACWPHLVITSPMLIFQPSEINECHNNFHAMMPVLICPYQWWANLQPCPQMETF